MICQDLTEMQDALQEDEIRRASIGRYIAIPFCKSNRIDKNLSLKHALKNRVAQLIRTTKSRYFRVWFRKEI